MVSQYVLDLYKVYLGHAILVHLFIFCCEFRFFSQNRLLGDVTVLPWEPNKAKDLDTENKIIHRGFTFL